MYESHTQAMLQRILNSVNSESDDHTSQVFHSRLGANFYSMHALFLQLYGNRADAEEKLTELIAALASRRQTRSVWRSR